MLPVPEEYSISLGEGATTLLHLVRLGEAWGLRRLYAKVEGQNPTWSHKDRLCAVGAAAARWLGVKVLTAASTGNHGGSTAAYAARAGLGCVVFTVASVPATMKAFMQSYGAAVIATRTYEERNALMVQCVERFGWYPLTNSVSPPVGSSPYGVDGYKTIAYELWKQLGEHVPDWVVVPVGNGDCLSGIWRGFTDLRDVDVADRRPKLVGAEVFGPLTRALVSPDAPFEPVPTGPTHAFSIGGAHTTYQAVHAVRDSMGTAAAVTEDELIQAQLALGACEGIYAEAASAVALAAARKLRLSGGVGADDCVVVILTSSGLKDPGATAAQSPPVPVIAPTVDAVQATLREQWEAGGRRDAEELFFGTTPWGGGDVTG